MGGGVDFASKAHSDHIVVGYCTECYGVCRLGGVRQCRCNSYPEAFVTVYVKTGAQSRIQYMSSVL